MQKSGAGAEKGDRGVNHSCRERFLKNKNLNKKS
jgi:hypothetical protein